MRGEKEDNKASIHLNTGSSPHARGKVIHIVKRYSLSRIIPACAGKSGEAVDAINNDQDHPRMRGEKLK